MECEKLIPSELFDKEEEERSEGLFKKALGLETPLSTHRPLDG